MERPTENRQHGETLATALTAVLALVLVTSVGLAIWLALLADPVVG